MDDGQHLVTLTVDDDAYRALKGIAKRRGKDVGAVIGDALAFDEWASEKRSEGYRLLLERDGKARPIERTDD